MKRYEIADSMGYYMEMREDDEGRYVKYKDVIKLLKLYIDASRNSVTEKDIEMVVKHF